MASSPTYDPNVVEEQLRPASTGVRADCRRPRRAPQPRHGRPLRAGLDLQGRDRLGRDRLRPLHARLELRRPRLLRGLRQAGQQLRHDRGRSAGSTSRTALKYSVNSVFCNIGKELGAQALVEYAKRFGFYATPPLETPSNERAPSGLYKGTKLFDPKEDTEVDPGRFAFGQERLLVTPLQMAMVAGDDRERRRRHAPVRRRPDRRAGRLDRRPHEAAGARPRRQAGDGARRSRR